MSVKENVFVSMFSVATLLVAVLTIKAFYPIDSQQNFIWLIAIVLVLSTLSRSLARKVYKRLFEHPES